MTKCKHTANRIDQVLIQNVRGYKLLIKKVVLKILGCRWTVNDIGKDLGQRKMARVISILFRRKRQVSNIEYKGTQGYQVRRK